MRTHEPIESLSFEECYERLERVIATLEAGELDLDQSIALYEEGIRLAEYCGQKLDDAQIKVSQLLAAVEDDDEGDAASVEEALAFDEDDLEEELDLDDDDAEVDEGKDRS